MVDDVLEEIIVAIKNLTSLVLSQMVIFAKCWFGLWAKKASGIIERIL